METLHSALEVLLNLDKQIFELLITYESWIYLLLFMIVFLETGVVFMAFLPGDVLLFSAGTFCAGITNDIGQVVELNLFVMLLVLFLAAILGDNLNYSTGKNVGIRLLNWKIRNKLVINPKYLAKSSEFYLQHGAKTVVIARFLPLLRSVAPFVAGVTVMPYATFIRYNIIGGFIWVFSLVLLGYFFGNLSYVQNNFETVILIIISLSFVPMFFEIVRNRLKNARLKSAKANV